MKPIAIVGAGFSGLTLAYHLKKRGLDVAVFENNDRIGGLLNTVQATHGLVETAANAILADAEIEELFSELSVPFAERRPERKNRYIYWEKPRRWPLTPITTAKLMWTLAQVRMGNDNVLPKPGETVADWSVRTINSEFEQRLLSPALQGVFAGDPKRLSASLTLKSILGGVTQRGKLKGSVAPANGMSQLLSALRHQLEAQGVPFEFNYEFKLDEMPESPVVLCTSAWTAAEVVAKAHPELSEQLRHCESLPLVTATAMFEPRETDLKGFGCLFPPGQGFQASGAIFNSCVFEGRSDLRSETWIFGGALQLAAVQWSDDQIREAIIKDRQKLMSNADEPREISIRRWPRAIPHYTIQWEKILQNLNVPRPLFLHGNYLGGIGLSRIHRRSKQLADQLKDLYGA